MKPYAISYLHNGKRLNLWLYADGNEDALCQALRAANDGEAQEVVAMIPIASRRFDLLGWCLVLVGIGVILL